MRSFVLLYSSLLFVCSSPKAQTDSLSDILKYLYTAVADEKLRKAVYDARELYLANIINDSLSAKLLCVADLLTKSTMDKRKIISYNHLVADLFRQLPPEREHINYAYSLEYLAASYQYAGRHQAALPFYLEALSIKGKTLGVDHLDYAATLYQIGAIYLMTSQYDKALATFQKESTIKKTRLGEYNFDYVNCLINLSWSHHWMGHYDTALLLTQNLLILINQISKENSREHATTLMNAARLYHRMGQYERSLRLYERALVMKRQVYGEHHFEYANALVDVGYFYHRILGNYEKALLLYQEALEIVEQTLEKNDPEHHNIFEKLQFLYYLNLSHLGTVNYLVGRYNEALPFYKKALKVLPEFPSAMSNLANLYYSMGFHDSAFSLCQQISENLNHAVQKGPDYISRVNNLAHLFYNIGKFDHALPWFENSVISTREILGREHPDYVNSLNGLGMVYSASHKDSLAVSSFDEATNITLNYLSRTYTTLSEQEKIAILQKQALQFNFLPSYLFIKGLTQSPLVNKLYQNVITLKGMVLQDQHDVLHAIRKSGDSSILASFYKWRSAKAAQGLQQLLPLANRVLDLDSLENITNQLEQYLSYNSRAFRNQQKVDAITAKNISQELSKGHAAVEFLRFPLYNKKMTDSVLYAAIVVLPGDSIARFIPLFEEQQLQRLLRPYGGSTTGFNYIKRLYGSDTTSTETSEKTLNDSLFLLVWKPLEIHLKGINTVHYAPAGLLHRIAFKALRRNSSQLLINKYQLNQVLSTRSIVVETDKMKNPLTASVWGNIDYNVTYSNNISSNGPQTRGSDEINLGESFFSFYTGDFYREKSRGWSPLPESKKEMEIIKKTLEKSGIPVSVVNGGMATEEVFKSLDGKSPQLLHVATHGFFLSIKDSNYSKIKAATGSNSFTIQQNPMFRSGLVLAGGNHAWKGEAIPVDSEDGILTAYEIAQMDLSSTEVLVLTACETALGDLQHANEGVFGLQRAFKLAGVKKMIMSLWQVPDKETVELMTLFYNNWLSGQTIREALNNAQITMKEKGHSPFSWAAFVIVE